MKFVECVYLFAFSYLIRYTYVPLIDTPVNMFRAKWFCLLNLRENCDSILSTHREESTLHQIIIYNERALIEFRFKNLSKYI